MKQLATIIANNSTKDGLPRMNTAVRRPARKWYFRDMNDFLYNTMEVDTAAKALVTQVSSAIVLSQSLFAFNNLFCVGKFGIRHYT